MSNSVEFLDSRPTACEITLAFHLYFKASPISLYFKASPISLYFKAFYMKISFIHL